MIRSGPTVAVVIMAYNNEAYIHECLQSMLAQTYPLYQILLCEDCSTDGTRGIVRAYEKEYPDLIEAVYQPRNRGIPGNINSGLQKVRSDYYSVIAADDTWFPDKIRLEIERLQAVPEARWAYSKIVVTDAVGNPADPFEPKHFAQKYTGREGNILFPMLMHQVHMRNPLVESSLIREVSLYDEKLRIFEDWDYFIRLSEAAPVAWEPERTVRYRLTAEGISMSSSLVTRIEHVREVYRKHQGLIYSMPVLLRQQILEHKRVHLGDLHYMLYREQLKKGRRLSALRSWYHASLQRAGARNGASLVQAVLPYRVYRLLRPSGLAARAIGSMKGIAKRILKRMYGLRVPAN